MRSGHQEHLAWKRQNSCRGHWRLGPALALSCPSRDCDAFERICDASAAERDRCVGHRSLRASCAGRAGLRPDLRLRPRAAATSFSPTSRRRRCPSTISRLFPPRAIIGRLATGPGTITTITGSPASGWSRRNWDCCGRPATGPSSPASTPSGRAIGARMSDFTAASTMVSATTAPAILAADGITGGTFTIARRTTSAPPTSRMCTTRQSSTTRPSIARASTAERAASPRNRPTRTCWRRRSRTSRRRGCKSIRRAPLA